MTKAAQHFGKRLQDFMDNKETQEYILALRASIDAIQRELTVAPISRHHRIHRRTKFREIHGIPRRRLVQHDEGRKALREASVRLLEERLDAGYMLSLAESLELIRGKSPITHGASICGDIKDQLVEARKGWHENPDVGTWAHPKLAVFFARWLDVRFAVWCDAMIEDILKGKAEVTITKPAESAVMALLVGPNFSPGNLRQGWSPARMTAVPPVLPR